MTRQQEERQEMTDAMLGAKCLRRWTRRAIAAMVAVVALLAVTASTQVAQAAAPKPSFVIDAQHRPTNLPPGAIALVDAVVTNLGDGASDSPVTVSVALPPGVTGYFPLSADWECPTAFGASSFDCTTVTDFEIPARGKSHLRLIVMVDPAAEGDGVTTMTVSGGGDASPATVTRPVHIGTDPAPFRLLGFSGWATDARGQAARQAGSPIDASTDIQFSTVFNGASGLAPYASPENIKEILVDLPAGTVGYPTATPKCKAVDISVKDPLCRPETQVGVVDLYTYNGDLNYSPNLPLFNMEPPPGVPARLAFNILGVVTTIDATVRTGGDYGVTAKVSNISQTLPIASSRTTLWAVPADPVNDAQRRDPESPSGGQGGASSAAPRRAFMTAPTSCSPRLTTTASMVTWQNPTRPLTGEFSTDFNGDPISTEGCERLAFTPSFELEPSNSGRGTPSGVRVELGIPQTNDPDALVQSHLEKAVVTLPEGMVVNPSSADGLGACSPEQIDVRGSGAGACPGSSKLGTVTVETPVLDEPLSGAVYLAQQRRNPFGTTLALYLVVEGQGVVVKLPGRIDADPRTGRLTATFDDNPQLPFSKLTVDFKAGPRAALTLPTECGPATTTAVLTPWSGNPPVTLTSSFEVSEDGNGAPCAPLEFAPRFEAGSKTATAGGFSPFLLDVSRGDGDQKLSGLSVDMPEGLLARVGDVPLCGDAAAAAGSCGETSRVGSVSATAGSGPLPFAVPGRAYLTGPYKGAPYGLSVVVPAVAGPFDLGTVVVRAALHVDRSTAAVRVVSDPFPTILEGIPLQLRQVNVAVDRPGFVINPTDCSGSRVDGEVTSTAGATAKVSSRFQAVDCARLRFAPKLRLRMAGRKQTTTGRHPGFRARVTQRGLGAAAIDRAAVTLPKSLALDPGNAQALCEYSDGIKADLEKHCPKGSIVGNATAVSPLLERPLKGKVFFVKNVRIDRKTGNQRRTLPMLVVALRGEIAINLRGVSATAKDGRLVSRFDTVPDAPVTRFDLNIAGGGKGILAVTRTRSGRINLCAQPKGHRADVRMRGQNGRQANFATTVKTPCAKAAKAKAKARSGKHKRKS